MPAAPVAGRLETSVADRVAGGLSSRWARKFGERILAEKWEPKKVGKRTSLPCNLFDCFFCRSQASHSSRQPVDSLSFWCVEGGSSLRPDLLILYLFGGR